MRFSSLTMLTKPSTLGYGQLWLGIIVPGSTDLERKDRHINIVQDTFEDSHTGTEGILSHVKIIDSHVHLVTL